MVNIPDNYDWNLLKMSVAPAGLYDDALSIEAIINFVVGYMNCLDIVCNNLKLGWAGDTATAVQDWNDQTQKVYMEIFGPPLPKDASQQEQDDVAKQDEKPGVGMLEKFRRGMETAARNYAFADDGIRKAFTDLMHRIADTRPPDSDGYRWPAPDGYQPPPPPPPKKPGRLDPNFAPELPNSPKKGIPLPVIEHVIVGL